MSYYYCTCSSDPNKKKDVNAGRSPFREVPADREGVCLYCGFYAVVFREQIDPSQGKLYDELFKEIEWKPKQTKGGLSINTNKKMMKRRGFVGDKREDKNGDLDVESNDR